MSKEPFVFKSKVRVAISGVCNLNCIYCDNADFNANRTISMEDFRLRPISEGVLSLEEYLKVLQSFFDNGFNRVNFTGGEPMLNSEWVSLVNETKQIGFESVEMTTNGTLICDHLNRNDGFPQNLDRLIVSMDTCDPTKYREMVGKNADFSEVVNGVKMLKRSNPGIKLTANCVLCQSNRIELNDYIEFIVQTGFDSVTFLDLIVRDKRNQRSVDYFLDEFLSGKEIKQAIKDIYGDLDVSGGRHDYNVVAPSGLNISVVDTQGPTRRDELCDDCSRYCQEGYYTCKVATDGTIIDCLGGISIDARNELKHGDLDAAIKRMYDRLAKGKEGFHFDEFYSTLSGSRTRHHT